MSECVRACMCARAPEAINNWWRDMDLIDWFKQVLQLLYGLVSLIGMALVLIRFVEANPVIVS